MFDWSGFLELAERLAREEDEASQRSAISRAYYGAFHLARRHLERSRKGAFSLPPTGDKHMAVWRELQAGRGSERSAGFAGDRLRQLRNKADYENVLGHLKQELADALDRARMVRRLLEAAPPPST
jgi:hypothetical protein